jgi:hypothetical protein
MLVMDNDDDIQLHELETIEHNLESEQPPEQDAASGFMVLSASGFMVLSASGFMVL